VTSGPFQNVTASPTTGQAFVIWGSASTNYKQNVAFHKDAFTLAMVPMWAPPDGKGVIDVAQKTEDGFTVKVTEFYDGINDNSVMRIDVLFGWVATYPELSVPLLHHVVIQGSDETSDKGKNMAVYLLRNYAGFTASSTVPVVFPGLDRSIADCAGHRDGG
jgi:hypothetical protein